MQTNRMYVQLRTIGQCDAKGKSILAMNFSGKTIAEPDKPLTTLVMPLLREIATYARWSSREAAEADLAQLKEYVAGLKV